MFLEVLDMLFDSLETVVSSLNVHLFSVGTVSISFWQLILGLFITSVIFGFFLKERAGSGIEGIGSYLSADDRVTRRRESDQRKRDAAERRRLANFKKNNNIT